MGTVRRFALVTGLTLAVLSWHTARGGTPPPINIGLFIPTRGERAWEGRAVRQAAELAVAQVNAAGGLNGRLVRLVIGSADARWETSTGELVRLIYETDVWAIVGAVDGKSAHLAEQVVTRARGRVVFVTPWATDPTLTQINIPWFFRMVPDDRQQAAALIREIFEVRRFTRVAVVAEDEHDARMASEAFMKTAAGRAVTIFQYSDGEHDWASLAERLRQSRAEGWVLFGRPATAARLVHRLQQGGRTPPLFGPLTLACPEFLGLAGSMVEGAVLVVPGGVQKALNGQFCRKFEKAYGHPPHPLAFYAYDTLIVLTETIRKAGLNREAIRDVLVQMKHTGVTGPIEFDRRGNRRGRVEVAWVRNGRLW